MFLFLRLPFFLVLHPVPIYIGVPIGFERFTISNSNWPSLGKSDIVSNRVPMRFQCFTISGSCWHPNEYIEYRFSLNSFGFPMLDNIGESLAFIGINCIPYYGV
ncbi:hypothetical protein ANAPC5_01297 [Anaplasma phagocytophilum]|nr:hypothetical protein ANAPC5_01297 [Anaplasma phagocytophilum]